MTPRVRVLCAALAIAFGAVAGCGGPSAPSGGLNLSGAWSGTFQYVTAGVTVTDTVTLSLTQSGTRAAGAWTAAGLTTGSVSIDSGATISGTFQIAQPNVGGTACSASSSLSGTASETDMTFTVADIAPSAPCPWATGMKFVLKK
jgi:hypothetical protein